MSSRFTDSLENILDASVKHRKQFYNIVCVTEKEHDDFKGSQRIREFIILYFKAHVPFGLFFNRTSGVAKNKNELCTTLKNLNKTQFSSTMNATSHAIGISIFGLGTASSLDRALKGSKNKDTLAKTEFEGSFGFIETAKKVPITALVIGTILAVASTLYLGTRSYFSSISSSIQKDTEQARTELRRIDRHVPKRRPIRIFANMTLPSLRKVISTTPNYSILMLVRPDGKLRTSINEITKAYDLYNDLGNSSSFA
tara:strand:- start:64 stop:828 length:765 start_codon:yes stop_codon:yes gene_type:complete